MPSPLASKPRYALKASAVWTTPSLLTAVAVAVENDHTIAFLGNNKGEVFKVALFHLFHSQLFISLNPLPEGACVRLMTKLMSDSVGFFFLFVQVHLTAEAEEYSKAPGDTIGEKVNKNLFFDLTHSHLYITTEKKVR